MPEIEIGKVYRHFKGNYYLVLCTAIESENREEVVVYKALYDSCGVYVRPLNMFLSKIDINREDNKFKQEYRFERMDIKNDRY